MEFNIDKLSDEDLLVEFEVRGLVDKANQPVTQTLKEALVRKLEEEREDSFLVPTKAHQAARRQPQREIEACIRLLETIKRNMTQSLKDKVVLDEWLPNVVAKLMHIQGRAKRVSKSPKFYEMSANLREAVEELGKEASLLRRGKRTQEETLAQIEKIVIVKLGQKAEGRVLVDETQKRPGTSKLSKSGRDYFEADLVDGGEDHTLGFNENLDQLNLDADDLEDTEDFTDHHLHNSTRLPRTPVWSNTKLRQEVKTWKVKFQGLRSDMTVQRFLSRMEWHATTSDIPFNSLVRVLDLCLEDEALEWFWSTIDRNPGLTWEHMKQVMGVRFSPSTTDDDIRRMLSNRKQIPSRNGARVLPSSAKNRIAIK